MFLAKQLADMYYVTGFFMWIMLRQLPHWNIIPFIGFFIEVKKKKKKPTFFYPFRVLCACNNVLKLQLPQAGL